MTPCLDVFVCLRIWKEVKWYLSCSAKHVLEIRGLVVTFIWFAYFLFWLLKLGLWCCYSFNSCLRLVFHHVIGSLLPVFHQKKKKKKAFTRHKNKSRNNCDLLAPDQVLLFEAGGNLVLGSVGQGRKDTSGQILLDAAAPKGWGQAVSVLCAMDCPSPSVSVPSATGNVGDGGHTNPRPCISQRTLHCRRALHSLSLF